MLKQHDTVDCGVWCGRRWQRL